jgi:hypothetical protein
MSKRRVTVLALVVLLALSATVFAVLPTASSTPVSTGDTIAARMSHDPAPALFDQVCPDPNTGGCGG